MTGSGDAGSVLEPGQRYYRLTAVLKPGLVVRGPVGVRSATAGRVSIKVDRDYQGGGGHVVTPKMVFDGLTGPATDVHIHAGRPGRSGPVLYTLCAPQPGPGSSPRCDKVPGGFVWRAGPFYDPALVGPTYVDVHTKRNPGGELRGQITVTPLAR